MTNLPPWVAASSLAIVVAGASAFWLTRARVATTPLSLTRAPVGRTVTPAKPPATASGIHFVEVAEASGVRFQHVDGRTDMHYLMDTVPPGLAWLDYNGDGRLDLFAVQGSNLIGPPPDPAPTSRLFRNEGGGRFQDATAESGAGLVGVGQGAAVGDVDNDGDPDLFLTFFGRPNALLRNDRGHFVEVGEAAGLTGPVPGRSGPHWSTGAAFLDYDADGWLDLFVGHYVQVDLDHYPICLVPGKTTRASCPPRSFRASPCSLFRNRGDGTFEETSRVAGVDAPVAKALGVVALDVDDDGKIDLFVANDGVPNLLFHNLGDGRFTSVGPSGGASVNTDGRTQSYMGVDADDLDGDGRPDLYVTAYARESDTFFRNEGDGLFQDVTQGSGLGPPSWFGLAFGVAFLDADRDGRLDIAVANGHVDPTVDDFHDPKNRFRQLAQIYRNAGGGRFVDVSDQAGPYFQMPRVGRGIAAGDFNDDGLTDLAIANSGEPLALLRNDSRPLGGWLRLSLQGARGNRDAIGAKLTVKFADGTSLVRYRKGGGGYLSAADPRLLVGLGPHPRAESVEVRWPSGFVQTVGPLDGDRGYRIVEGSERVEPTP